MQYTYRASTDLGCSAADAWAVLVDFASYPAWNRFTRRMHGELVVGRWVRMHVVLGWFVLLQHERISEVAAPHRLGWRFPGPRWLLYAERMQTLTPTGQGCHYETVDTVEGVISPLVELLFGGILRRGFEQVAVGLEERVRALHGVQEPENVEALRPARR